MVHENNIQVHSTSKSTAMLFFFHLAMLGGYRKLFFLHLMQSHGKRILRRYTWNSYHMSPMNGNQNTILFYE